MQDHQGFFSHRIHILSGKWWIAAPAYLAQAFRATIGIAVAVLCTQSQKLDIFRARYSYIVSISLILSVIVSFRILLFSGIALSNEWNSRQTFGTPPCFASTCAAESQVMSRTYPFPLVNELCIDTFPELGMQYIASCYGPSV
jgi:hypothetical protein